MDRFGSVFDRMLLLMKVGITFCSSLKYKTLVLDRYYLVIVVDGATRSQKDGVEGREAP